MTDGRRDRLSILSARHAFKRNKYSGPAPIHKLEVVDAKLAVTGPLRVGLPSFKLILNQIM